MIVRVATLTAGLLAAVALVDGAAAQQLGTPGAPRAGACPAPTVGPKPPTPANPTETVRPDPLGARLEQAYHANPARATSELESLVNTDRTVQKALAAASSGAECSAPGPGPKPPTPTNPSGHPTLRIDDLLKNAPSLELKEAALVNFLKGHPQLRATLTQQSRKEDR